jgi:hypothetical protein
MDLHDIDQPDAYHAHRDAYVPKPNLIIINPANGHGHAAYLLATPVARHSAGEGGAAAFLCERGSFLSPNSIVVALATRARPSRLGDLEPFSAQHQSRLLAG